MNPQKNPTVTVGHQGRVVIPAQLRRQLHLSVGDALLATVEEDRLVLEKRSAVLARLRSRLAGVPRGVSLAEELLADRKGEPE